MPKKVHKHDHDGHRQRLKTKVREGSLSILAPHEIIELLLTYTIPYKDTNPLAHRLLNTFGSVDKVIDADYKDLLNIKGIGPETALYFKILSQLQDVYLLSKNAKPESIFNTADAVRFFRKHYAIKKVETLLILNLSKTNKIVSRYYIEGDDDISVNLDSKDFNRILSADTGSIIMFHTHPNGDPTPSMDDIHLTERLYKLCALMGIQLFDHIILNETEHYSFYNNNLLDEIKMKNPITNNNVYTIPSKNK